MRVLFAVIAFTLLSASAFAAPFTFDDAFVRETPSQISAAYVTIKNTGTTDDALQSVTADWADKAQLHDVKINDSGVLQMLPMKELPVKAKASAVLSPGGSHLMIYGIKTPLKAGDKKTMVLHFAKAGDVKVDFTVRPITYRGKADAKNSGKGMDMDHMNMKMDH